MKVIIINGSEKLESNFGVSTDYDYEKMTEYLAEFVSENSIVCVYNLEKG